MQSTWVMKNIRYDYEGLAKMVNLPVPVVRCIINRGPGSLAEVKAYLDPSLKDLHDGGLMKDMDLAVDLLLKAVEEEEKILLVGDYDIDGTMSMYIALKALEQIGAVVDYDIPDRVMDGYGINVAMVEKAKENGVSLLVTFDNGISAVEAVERAKELGMEVIVTDHHEVPFEEVEGVVKEILPPAHAVVNPKQKSCPYPFKGLCGAAIAYKLMEKLFQAVGLEETAIEEYLHFAAIATVGDIMPLMGENRILVKKGLERLRSIDHEGLQALAEAADTDLKEVNTYIIGFVLGPCFNAAGRLSSAKKTVELLFAKGQEAKSLARELYALNQERKDLTEEGIRLAMADIEAKKKEKEKLLVVHLPEVHESLAGIIAGRLKERYYRPSIVFTTTEKGLKGSGRSIEEYNMAQELQGVKAHLAKFGGHPMAAGMTLKEGALKAFEEDLLQRCALPKELLPTKRIDAKLSPFDIDEAFVRSLEKLEPFGVQNPKPLFAEKGLLISQVYLMGKNKDHMKLLFQEGSHRVEAVYFSGVSKMEAYLGAQRMPLPEDLPGMLQGKRCDVLYHPGLNTYQGVTKVQIILEDFRWS